MTGRSLANAYAQTLGSIFTETAKPYEVEIVVAEVGADESSDQMYRLTSTVWWQTNGIRRHGRLSEAIEGAMSAAWQPNQDLETSLRQAVNALGQHGTDERRTLSPDDLEVAIWTELDPGACSTGWKATPWTCCRGPQAPA